MEKWQNINLYEYGSVLKVNLYNMGENCAHRTNIKIIFCIIKIPKNLKLKLPNFKQLPCMNKLMPLLESGNKTKSI